jgi:uncharacterized integral membrane protein (TIGR00697 family)
LIGGWTAVFLGDISNNYIMARLKVITKGKMLWLRTIGSTVVGQGINTAAFYIIALSGILPQNVLIQGILAGWIMKTIVEALMTPFTYALVSLLKKKEKAYFYDTETNFNPFIIN